MPPQVQEPQLNFGGIPKAATGAAPPAPTPDRTIPLGTPASASTTDLNFGGIPKLAPAQGTKPGAFDPNQSRDLAATTRGDLAGKVLDSYDPTTPHGRMNIGSTAAGLAAAPFLGPAAPWIARILGPGLVGASVGTAIELGEQVAGVHPPSTSAALTEGGLQAGYEYGGRALLWLPRKLLTLPVAGNVARHAGKALREGVDAARTQATETIDAAREQGRRYLESVRGANQTEIRAAKAATGTERAEIERVGAEDLADLQQTYDDLIAAPPSTVQAGRDVRAAVQRQEPRGPAQKALDLAGEEVAKAAETGPGLAVTPLKDALDRMIAQARPDALFAEKPKTPGLGFLATIRARKGSGLGAAAASTNVTAAEQTRLQQLIAKELGITEPSHPLPGILGRVAALPDGGTLAFADAHQLKRLLDESVTWDQVSKKHIGQITKSLRGDLRDMLGAHESYNTATAKYADVVRLYRSGVGSKLIKTATEDPDQVVKLLAPDKPQQAAKLKRLLVEQSAKGGDVATGWTAWQAVQSAYTYDKIIKGGLPGLSQRVAKTLSESPEFARVVYGDDTGRRVLSNLDALGTAWQVAETGLKSDLADHVVTSGARQQAVGDTAASRLRTAREDATDTLRTTRTGERGKVAAAKGEVARFRESKTGGVEHATSPAVDALYAATLGPKAYVGARAVMRMLSGPSAAELAQWVSHSPELTQRVVAALNSRLPDAGVAALVRDLGTIVRTELTTPGTSAQNTRQ